MNHLDCTTLVVKSNLLKCSLLHYVNSKRYYKMISIDLSKQQALDADPKAIQQINFIGNLVKLLKNWKKPC